jgi:hypothetical protein
MVKLVGLLVTSTVGIAILRVMTPLPLVQLLAHTKFGLSTSALQHQQLLAPLLQHQQLFALLPQHQQLFALLPQHQQLFALLPQHRQLFSPHQYQQLLLLHHLLPRALYQLLLTILPRALYQLLLPILPRALYQFLLPILPRALYQFLLPILPRFQMQTLQCQPRTLFQALLRKLLPLFSLPRPPRSFRPYQLNRKLKLPHHRLFLRFLVRELRQLMSLFQGPLPQRPQRFP